MTGSSVDFDSNPFNITIDAGEITGFYNISINYDGVVEGNESFNLLLSLTGDNNEIIIGHTAIVQISDSTGKYYVFLITDVVNIYEVDN